MNTQELTRKQRNKLAREKKKSSLLNKYNKIITQPLPEIEKLLKNKEVVCYTFYESLKPDLRNYGRMKDQIRELKKLIKILKQRSLNTNENVTNEQTL